jgi:hypothetical protein
MLLLLLLIWVDMLTEVGRKLDKADVEAVALVIVISLLLLLLMLMLLLTMLLFLYGLTC